MDTPIKKTIKYALIGLAAAIGLVVVAVAAFVATFDPNAWKAEAAQAVKDATGRELAIPGELELELFPWLALRTGRIELGNAVGFDGPFATIERFEARVKVAPLFRGEVEIGAIALDGVAIALQVDAAGRDNWSDLGGETAPAPAATPAAAPAAAPRALSVAGLTLADATLSYRDARDGSGATVSDLDLAVGAIAAGQPVRVDGSAAFATLAADPAAVMKGKVGFGARLVPGAAPAAEALVLAPDAEGGALPAPLAGGRLAIARIGAGETLAVEGLEFEGWGIALAGALARATVDGAPTLTGRLASQPFAPREVLPRLGIALPVTADPKALSTMSFAFDLEQRGDRLALERFKLGLDGSAITGRIALDSIERGALRFDLALDALDADRYLAPPAPADAPAADGGLAALKLETAWLKGLDVAGTLRAGKLAVAKVDLADLRLVLEARDGVLKLKPFGAALYGGKVQGEATLDARGAQPAARFKLALAGLRIGDLMADAFDSKMVSGIARLDLDLGGQGGTVGAIKASLDGTARFQVDDGALEGFNLWKSVRVAWATLKKRTTPAASEPDRTPFEALTGGATVSAGVATLADVRAAIRFAEVTAKGRVDLGRDLLKVEAKAKITAAPEFGPGENLTELAGATLPVAISGPFAKPEVDVDLTKVAGSLLKPKVEEKLKKKLKGLF